MDMYEVLRTRPHSERHLARYVKFIQSRQFKSELKERHHICPKAADLFPEYSSFANHPWNRIDLTPREHYVAHLLLWKTYGGSQAMAIASMSSNRKKSSRLYAIMKSEMIQLASERGLGIPLAEDRKAKISSTLKGRKLSPETREKMSLARRGKLKSPETKRRMAEAQMGKTLSLAHREKISKSLQR